MKQQRAVAALSLFFVFVCSACGGFESPTQPGSPTPIPAQGSSVDLGNPADEAHHALRGWGAINPGLSFPPEPGADRSSRYQLVRLSNSVDLVVPQASVPYTLVFRTEDGVCDDSFNVYVNEKGPLYRYRHRESGDNFPIHRVAIAADVVETTVLSVNFLNIASDNCGFAAVYYIRAE